MALKSKITKDDYEALPDALKEHYKAHGDNFVLDTDDAAELRAAKEREAAQRKIEKERADRLQAERDEAEERARAAALDKAKKDKDIEALETSWKTEKETAVSAANQRAERRESQLRELLVENKALEIANEISTMPKLLVPIIRARLSAELDGEKPFTRVLDDNGQPSAKTIADLRQEFIDNKEYATIIKGTNANGGGAGGNSGSGGGAGSKKFNEMTEAERVALHRENPDKFREMQRAGA